MGNPAKYKRTIWKYKLKIDDGIQEIEVPYGARFHHVDMIGDTLCVWAYVRTEDPTVIRRLIVHGTGHAFLENYNYAYIGTALQKMDGVTGTFVWHVFEVTKWGL